MSTVTGIDKNVQARLKLTDRQQTEPNNKPVN